MKVKYTKAAYCTILLFLLNLTAYSQETWTWSYPSPQGNSLNSVTWVSGSVFIAVGDHGTILRSTNDGVNWISISSGVSTNLNKVRFASSTIGYAVGASGTVLKTTDGGATWSQSTSPDANELKAVCFTSESVGYTGNSFGTVYKTTNGGTGWSQIHSGAGIITSIQFLDAQTGYLASNTGLYKTTNGGTIWTSPSTPNITDMVFTDASNGWYIYQNQLFQTTNGGLNWLSNSGASGTSNSIAISNTNIFVAGSLTFVDKFTLSGTTLSTFSKLYGILNSVAVNNSSVVIAVGEGGNIFKSTNSGTDWSGILQEPNYYSLNSITKKPNGNIFAAGEAGTILSSTDEGVTWSQVASSSSSFINKIFFTNDNTGWYAAGRYLYKTTNGGTSWSVQYTNSTSTYAHLDVRFFDATNGITIARNSNSTLGFVYYTTNGGTWVLSSPSSDTTMYSISYLGNKNDAFLCGKSGRLLKSTNAGANWSSVSSGTSNTLYSIYFVNSSVGYAAGAGGTIIKTTDGGTNWSSLTSGTVQDLSDIRFYDELHGMASGANGTVLMTNNGGTTWIQKSLPTNNNLNEAVIVNQTTAFVVGVNTSILKGASLPLPVELTSFTASVRSNTVHLNWETATEVDNYGFEVERKDNSTVWTKIGFVEGHYTSNSPKYYNYTDKPTGSGKYSYRLKQIDNDGEFEYSPEVEVLIDNLPNGYLLEQNYPNPFNPETSIKFVLKENTKATLKVYKINGELVATLFDGIAEAGRYYDIKFTGTNLASGLYLYTLDAGKYRQTRKMILLK